MVKLTDDDLLVAHATFDNYIAMVRIFKQYDFEYSGAAGPIRPSHVTFSSYGGPITSTDDYYILNKKVVVQETTTALLNENEYQYRLPLKHYIPDFFRISIANHMSQSGQDWITNFSYVNTGTYNSQWMVVDYTKFPSNDKLLMVLEQAPGKIIVKDMTPVLLKEKYWASYNIPSFPETREKLGYEEIVTRYKG